jgi:hypothetical protein
MHIVWKWLRESSSEASVCWTWQTVPYLKTSSTSYWVRNSRSWTHSIVWWIQSAHVCVLKNYVNVSLKLRARLPNYLFSWRMIVRILCGFFTSLYPPRLLTRMTRTGNRLSYFGMDSDYCRLRFCFVVLRSYRSLWPHSVRPLSWWDCRFESRWKHGCPTLLVLCTAR